MIMIKNKFKNLSTYNKLVFCFLFITLFIILVIGMSSYQAASLSINKQTIEQTTEMVKQLSESLDNFCELMTSNITNVSTNPIVQQELNASSDDVNIIEDNYYSRYKQIRFVMVQAYSSIYMYDLMLQGNNGADYFISVDGSKLELSDINAIKQKASEEKGKAIFINTISENGYLQIIKEVKDNLTRQSLGYVRSSIKSKYINTITETIDFGADGKVIVLDHNNEIISNNSGIETTEIVNRIHEASGISDITFDHKKYVMIYDKSAQTGWKIIALIPREYVINALSPLKTVVFFSVFFTILICVLISNLLARTIVRPIESTADAMKKFSNGDFSIRLEEDRKDELGVMAAGFNRMVMQVQELINQVTQAKLLEKELEFKALQAQINPHFLYNALDTVNWMARKRGEDDICHMIMSLSNLMRGSISNKQSIISLEQEFKYVEDYLYIQKTRYCDKINVVYSVDETLLSQFIPKLTIQPIIENSIVHGIEESTHHCELIVIISKGIGEKGEAVIRISVRDTGIGIEPEKLEHILKESNDKQSNGIDMAHTGLGVYAVDKRLKYIFGDEYGLKMGSEWGSGTITYINIPYYDNPEDLKNKCDKSLKGE